MDADCRLQYHFLHWYQLACPLFSARKYRYLKMIAIWFATIKHCSTCHFNGTTCKKTDFQRKLFFHGLTKNWVGNCENSVQKFCMMSYHDLTCKSRLEISDCSKGAISSAYIPAFAPANPSSCPHPLIIQSIQTVGFATKNHRDDLGESPLRRSRAKSWCSQAKIFGSGGVKQPTRHCPPVKEHA